MITKSMDLDKIAWYQIFQEDSSGPKSKMWKTNI